MPTDKNGGADFGAAPLGNVRDGTTSSYPNEEFSKTDFPGAKERAKKVESSPGTASTVDVWAAPISLRAELLPVPEFDPEFLPEQLRAYVLDCANRIQCPVDFIAAGVVVFLSSIIGAGCAIRPHRIDDWTVVPNLWGAAIGNPSSKKSPALNAAIAPLAPLEKHAEFDFQKMVKNHELDAIENKIRKEKLCQDLKSSISNENENEINLIRSKISFLGDSAPPSPKRYKTSDVTVEKLQELLKGNPRGLLQHVDELMSLLSRLDQEGREAARAFYLEAWTGWSHTRFQTDRIGRGSISCNPCLAIFGGIQPSKLRLYLKDSLDSVGNDGLIQRFQLLVFPDRPTIFKLVDRHPDRQARQTIEEIARNLATTNFLVFGAVMEDEFPLPVFRFNANAQGLFHQWLGDLEARLMILDDDLIAQHLAKYRSLVPSLALIFYLVRASSSGTIPGLGVDLQDLERARKFASYLEQHARRVYSMVERRGVHSAKQLLEKIRRGEVQDGFTQREVRRNGWSALSSPADVEAALEELIEHHWLKPESVGTTEAGGRPSVKYRIHPLLKACEAAKTDKTAGGADEE